MQAGLLAVLVAFALPRPSTAAPYVDRRVDALSAQTLRMAPVRTLFDAPRQAAGRNLQMYRDEFFVVRILSQVVVLLVFWRSGRAARLRETLRRRVRRRRYLRFTYAACLTLVAASAALPVFVVQHHVQRVYGLERTGLLPVLAAATGEALLAAVVVGAAVSIVLALVDRTRMWYFEAAVAVCGLVVAAAIVPGPLLSGTARPYRPRAAVQARLSALLPTARPGAPLYVARTSARIEVVGAKSVGIGSTARIILGPTLIKDATAPEIAYEIARVQARIDHFDTLRLAVAFGAMLVFAIAIAVALVEQVRVRPGDDALSRLAMVFAATIACVVLLLPSYRAYERRLADAADATALRRTRDPVAATRFLVRVADERMTPACPIWPLDPLLMPVSWPAQRVAAVRGLPDPCGRQARR